MQPASAPLPVANPTSPNMTFMSNNYMGQSENPQGNVVPANTNLNPVPPVNINLGGMYDTENIPKYGERNILDELIDLSDLKKSWSDR